MPRFVKTDTALSSVSAYHAFGAPERPVLKQEGLLDHVTAPTLVLVGQTDWICPVAEGQRLNQGIQTRDSWFWKRGDISLDRSAEAVLR